MLLVCKLGVGVSLPGVDAVEHSGNKGAPGAFAPFVGSMEHIQAILKI